MAHDNTVFSQILKLIPRHEFESLARAHHRGRAFRSASRWLYTPTKNRDYLPRFLTRKKFFIAVHVAD